LGLDGHLAPCDLDSLLLCLQPAVVGESVLVEAHIGLVVLAADALIDLDLIYLLLSDIIGFCSLKAHPILFFRGVD
jgi:hypothetical protein